MKDTPITNEYALTIKNAIENLASYSEFETEPFTCMYPAEFASDLQQEMNALMRIDIEKIKIEFVDTLEDYSKLFFQKRVFEYKFEVLLNWKYDYTNRVEENVHKYKQDFYVFTDYQMGYGVDTHSLDYRCLGSMYEAVSARITLLKQQLKTMLGRYEELGRIYLEEHNLKIVSKDIPDEPVKPVNKKPSCVRVTSKRKTDVIKILSAMYDAKMFAGEDGKPLTNKQKMMDAFGEFLGDDFSAYSASLTQAKNRDRKTFMKPFSEIEKVAERYLEYEG